MTDLFITEAEIAAVTAARLALAAVNDRLLNAFIYHPDNLPEYVDDRDLGRVEAFASIAADALFGFLNQADSYLRLNVPYYTMHLRAPEVAEPETVA